jgi:nucleoside-diphosphate-sugar epimerase
MIVKAGSHKVVLVTGATGFIGRCCLKLLVESGFEVHAVSSHAATADARMPVEWHRLDLLDGSSPVGFLDDLQPSYLLHLAWFAKPGAFWSSEENFRWLTASTELFRAFYAVGGQRAVGAGTCAEYRWVTDDCDEERTPLQPETVYGRCKLATSLATAAAASLAGQNMAWARIFFPYGPGEPDDRFIPSVIGGLLRGESIACTHGNQIRDFIYVDDVARALVALLSGTACGAFNVGTGRSTSLREIAGLICSRLGHTDRVEFGAKVAPVGDPQRVVASINRLKSGVGWQPSVSLEQGIDNTIAAWRDRLHIKEK